jgi:hypothetical protein
MEKFNKVLVVYCVVSVVVSLGFLGVSGYNKLTKPSTPKINPQIVEQFNSMNGEFQYIKKLESKAIEDLIKEDGSLCPNFLVLQKNIKDYRAQEKELQTKANTLLKSIKKTN